MKLLFLGTQEIIVIAVIVLLLFGGKKIPELMRGLGRGVRSFKEGMAGDDAPAEPKSNAAAEDKKAADSSAQDASSNTSKGETV